MPLLARLFIKTALAYLVLALLLGATMAAYALVGGAAWTAALGPAQLHMFVVGWLTQLIFGVAYWFFPRVSKAAPYGHPTPVWAAYILLNAGVALRIWAEPAVAMNTSPAAARWALAASALAQTTAMLLMGIHLWTRVRAR